mmetsp:Transcript_2061/g.3591  ORF Transcript_2061/g.3591 Transcript_2061/m.3591 type:complete len:253 (+) Transcript_2061:203-961(+)
MKINHAHALPPALHIICVYLPSKRHTPSDHGSVMRVGPVQTVSVADLHCAVHFVPDGLPTRMLPHVVAADHQERLPRLALRRLLLLRWRRHHHHAVHARPCSVLHLRKYLVLEGLVGALNPVGHKVEQPCASVLHQLGRPPARVAVDNGRGHKHVPLPVVLEYAGPLRLIKHALHPTHYAVRLRKHRQQRRLPHLPRPRWLLCAGQRHATPPRRRQLRTRGADKHVKVFPHRPHHIGVSPLYVPAIPRVLWP